MAETDLNPGLWSLRSLWTEGIEQTMETAEHTQADADDSVSVD